jgi:chemotaxis protein MotB
VRFSTDGSSGGIEPFDADQMIENDMEVHHQQATLPIIALSTMADSLPGLGIVAAVLGVVITMGSLGGPPEEIGHKVASALVGTFLGILLCYGLVGPVSSKHGQGRRRRTFLLSSAARDDRRLPERDRPDDGGGNRTARNSRSRPPDVPGCGEIHKGQGRRVGSCLDSRPRGPTKMAGPPPIIVIKKKGGHGGHHTGAWRVAYADFVTAMMALFIVLWLLNSSKQVQDAVGGYFKDPTGTSKKVGSDMVGQGENFVLSKDNMEALEQQLQKAIREVPNFDKLKNRIDMTVTNEGLRIELLESAKGTFFDMGSPELDSDGQDLVIKLAQELGKLPNKIAIEGHTDSKPYSGSRHYSNWELSTDRANSARRLMQVNGIRADQVTQVRGFADQRLRKIDAPLDPINRRLSLIVQYLVKPSADDDPKPGAAGAAPAGVQPPDGAPPIPAPTTSAPAPATPHEK